jgi:CRISPR-associated protein Csb2
MTPADVLTLELELLTGAYRAALPDGSGAEWPPHPERVFSALVQAWGDGGQDDREREALEWLEALSPPAIEASARVGADGRARVASRDAPVVFVPPNDPRGDQIEVLPAGRRRQQRSFEASIPERALVRMQWGARPEPDVVRALGAIAHRVASVGHSSSLARLSFHVGEAQLDPESTWSPREYGEEPLRATYRDRLSDLRRWYSTEGGKALERPRSLCSMRYAPPGAPEDTEVPESSFGGPNDWIVFEDAAAHPGGPKPFRPDLLGLAHVARRLRDALMANGPQPPSEILCGHEASGRPSQRPHVAFVPLANVGWPHADGELLGMAVVLPRGLDPEERRALLSAIGAALGKSEWRLALVFGKGTWLLQRSPSPERASLRAERWCGVSRVWASATPVLLDRFPEHDDPIEEARILASACRNVGLPEPKRIEIHKHSAVKAAPSAYPARGSKSVPDWSFPASSSVRSRPRRHVVLEFERPVRGPVILSAGRYSGFGLCLPLGPRRTEERP